MRYAFMTFSTPDLSLDEILELAKELGYDGIEPRIGSGHAHGIETSASGDERDAFRRAAETAGIAYCCVATSCRYADPTKHSEMIQLTKDSLDLASDIGAPRLRVFGGKIPEGMTRQDGSRQVVRSLEQVADHAAERGVTICMETHDDWCDPLHVAEVMDAVDHPAIAVNWDIMHPVRIAGSTMQAAFDCLEPWIRHCHVHDGTQQDGKLTLQPIGQGMVDHAKAIELLKAIDFDGYLSGEWINWKPARDHLPQELATLKKLAADL